MKAAQPFALFNLIGELISGWRAIASAPRAGGKDAPSVLLYSEERLKGNLIPG